MTIPTPASLAESLTDFGQGFITEVFGNPVPALGAHIQAMAKRVADRIEANDPKLIAFQSHTDLDGYVWLSSTLHDLLAQAMRESWSFDRWFTALAQEVARADPFDADELAELLAGRRQFDAFRAQGLRLAELDYTTGAVVFTR